MNSDDASILNTFPFSSHLAYNYIPSNDEINEIKAFLVEPINRVREMEIQMGRLREELAILTNKHDQLCDQVDACKSLYTLPRRMPNDILGEIFLQSLPMDNNALMCESAAPWIFTRICSQWRQVALSCPRLWSTLHINDVPNPNKRWIKPTLSSGVSQDPEFRKWNEYRADNVMHWLEWSSVRPLHISLHAHLEEPPTFDLLFVSITPFASRWKTLSIKAPWNIALCMKDIKAQDLPLLECLSIDYGPETLLDLLHKDEDVVAWHNSGLWKAQSLRKLSVRQYSMDPRQLHVNWNQLTHLEFGTPFGGSTPFVLMCRITNVLRHCVNLVYCRLDVELGCTIMNGPIYPMNLPFLRRLSIYATNDISFFIERLEAAKLQEIDFRSAEKVPDTCLSSLLQRGSIQKLVIDSLYLSHESFLVFLRQCPALISLKVKQSPGYCRHGSGDVSHSFRIDDDFLALLTHAHDGLCHLLEEFLCQYIGHFSVDGMMEFIRRKQEGRISGLAKLKKISILSIPKKTNSDNLQDELKKRASSQDFVKYTQDGMAFHIGKAGARGNRPFDDDDF